jgi:hypothetical protein
MNRFHIAAMTLTAGIGIAALTGTTTAAAGDPFVGMQILDELCESKGGLAVNSPYHIARCQGARANKGFDLEQQICEGLLEGTFISAPFLGHPNRTTWACVAS